jgi:hypothetical protein
MRQQRSRRGKAIFESTIRLGQASLQFYEGLSKNGDWYVAGDLYRRLPQVTIIADAALQQEPKSQSTPENVDLPQDSDQMTVSKIASSEF